MLKYRKLICTSVIALLPLIAMLLAAPSVFAGTESGQTARSEHATVTILLSEETVQPGQKISVAVIFDLDPHWHTYWINPGDSGIPALLEWEFAGSDNVFSPPVSATFSWPVPERIPTPPLMTYGYEDEVILLSSLTVPENIEGDTVQAKARLDWLECNEICLPGEGEFLFTLNIGDSVSPETAANKEAIFEQARAALPIQSDVFEPELSNEDENLRIIIRDFPASSLDRIEDVYFFPEEELIIRHAEEQVFSIENGNLHIVLKKDTATGKVETLNGVLEITDPDGKNGWQIEAEQRSGILIILRSILFPFALAFAGGMLLNVMPCVLPVLSLKVMNLIEKAGESRANSLKHGLVFSGGVLFTFWILAGLLLILRSGGEQLGWGFQLQSPAFLAFLSLFLFLFSLNLLGVFEIGLTFMRFGNGGSTVNQGNTANPKQSGFSGSFLTGILATIVATPCTAPFMGSAIGFALSESSIVALTIFTGLALGMSSPYILIAGFPTMLRFVPKPGPWMESLKQFLAFPLIATVIWLLWIFTTLSNANSLALLLFAILFLSLAAWVYGRFAGFDRKAGRRRIALAIATAMLMISGFTAVQASKMATHNGSAINATSNIQSSLSDSQSGIAQSENDGEKIQWQAFRPELVEELREEQIVFIDFTADWCLTCMVNERVAFRATQVIETFEKYNVAAVKADWTARDDIIAAELSSYGRSGVPFYIIHIPGKNSITLPEVLTPGIVINALERAAEN